MQDLNVDTGLMNIERHKMSKNGERDEDGQKDKSRNICAGSQSSRS